MSKLGRKIVYHLVTYDDGLEVLRDKGITEDYFLFESKDAYIYVRDNILKGRVPTINEVQDVFKIKLESVADGDIEYLAEAVRKRYVTAHLNPHIENAIKAIEISDPAGAIEELLKVSEYKKYLEDNRSIHSFKLDGEERFDLYLEAQAKGGVLGIPSMWKAINETCGGYIDFTVIAAFTNVGKTWALCIIADDISKKIDKDGCILFITTEMHPKRIGRRVDSVKHKINFQKLKKGDLDNIEEDEWMQLIDDAANNNVDYGDIIIDMEAKTVEDIKLLVKELDPAAVLIDGGYRLKPSRKGRYDSHGAQVAVIREIQEAQLQTEIPWIVSTQVGEVDEKKKGRVGNTYNGMKYAKEWMIDPDNVFLLRQTADHKAEDKMVWTNGKLRDGDSVGEDWQTHWNPKTSTYDDLSDQDVYKPAGAGSAVFDNDDGDDDDRPDVPQVDPTTVMP